MPDRHCSLDLGPNIAPALAWSGIPAGTAQLLFILEDIDVPMTHPGLHTIALLDPATTPGLAEGDLTPDNKAIRYAPCVRGRTGYLGPRPLPGHGLHHYGFHLYALSTPVPADHPLTGLPDVLTAVSGHVLAAAFLEGIKRG
ncbi:YbhB/YbcL family Raf kinase inhibitor-like protein [Winogradskya humida]|nr:YbhB/YbcL family Raf kinase inhibitor-like protein [Actinoplanes humidus]